MPTASRLFVIPTTRPILAKTIVFMSSCSARRLEPCEPSPSPACAEEESRNVRVWAWWDFKNCPVPSDFDASKVTPTIMEAVRANGIKGPLNITAFGDVQQLPRAHQEALVYTGVRFIHVSNRERNSADILVDLMYWVSQNPPPAHIFMISGDIDFAGTLHRLRMSNYNILLATPKKTPDVLLHSAATIAWHWYSMLKGQNLTGKVLNHPPDGPFGSWYGSFKEAVTLADLPAVEVPVTVAAPQVTTLPNVEVYGPSLSSVPKSVARQVRHILSLHPKGLDISNLRAELVKCDVRLEKNLYGHKKFSRFLMSLPRVEVRDGGDGSFTAHLVPSKSMEPSENRYIESAISGAKNEEAGCAAAPELNGQGKSKVRNADGKLSIASDFESSLGEDLTSFQPGRSQGRPVEESELRKSSLACDWFVDLASAPQSETQLLHKDTKDSKTKMDSLKMGSKKLSDNDTVRSKVASMEKHTTKESNSAGNDQSTVENNVMANYESGNFEAKNKCENPVKEIDEVFRGLSLPVDGAQAVQTPGGSAETNNRSPTLFHWIRRWWPFGKNNEKCDDSTTHQNKVVSHVEDSKLSELDQTASQSEEPNSELDHNVSQSEEPKLSELDHPGKTELFSSASFWNDMESFIFAPRASLLFSQSRSREDVVQRLQNGGPLLLRSLPKKDILQLVEMLIAEKKWLEEMPSQKFPLKLTKAVHKNSMVDQSHGANGLRSLFLSRTSQSNLQKSLEPDVEKHNQNVSHTPISAVVTETKYSERSRNDILNDCQKLVSEILREHPEGYNVSSFRRLFVDTYGYHLDIKKLGYQKLAALLQIMPGVKLESTYIFPSVHAVCDSDLETSILETQATTDNHAVSNADSELSESTQEDDDMESRWEELGPVSITNSDKNCLGLKSSKKAIELDVSKSKHPDYELVSDDESAASEGDDSCLTQSEEHRKSICNERDSSFWQAMDFWHSCKEGENSVKKSDNFDSLGVSLADILDSSTESTSGTISGIPSSNYRDNIVKKSDDVDSLDVSLADIFDSSLESTRVTPSKTSSLNYRDKQKTHKNYSFVVDPVLPNKGKLIDDLKKVDESKMQKLNSSGSSRT
ncbi:unnamed protein product [Sphenostylis stenocarpa]|uniref:HTH OST-type domain-containing protein n=1 Tax=Sphenostylis stenocarpa TaxID=92480 RepID=A0AA86SH38_9FABA|nr:unnamed protein product [Sphenostylis stenocarpa]